MLTKIAAFTYKDYAVCNNIREPLVQEYQTQKQQLQIMFSIWSRTKQIQVELR